MAIASRRLVLCLLTLPLLAVAQQEPTVLETITVTAGSGPQDEREVPLSITVIEQAQLARARIATVEDISRYAANTEFVKNQLYIRGIGTSNTFGFDPSVPVFADGVYLGRGSAALMPYWDLEQIEIVRGPQGSLLGRNTIGGALILSSAEPAAEPALVGAAAHGQLDPYSLRGAASLPLGEDFGLRLSGLTERLDGYVRNTTLDREALGRRSTGLRLRMDWRPESAARAWLVLEQGEQRLHGFASQLSAATPESLRLYRAYDPETEADVGDYRAAADDPDSGGGREGQGGTLNLRLPLAGGELVSISHGSRARVDYGFDADYSPMPLLTLALEEDYRQWSQELRYRREAGAFGWTLGGYWFESRLGIRSRIAAFPKGTAGLASELSPLPDALPLDEVLGLLVQAGLDPVSDNSRKQLRKPARVLAGFGQIDWRPAPRWALGVGLRLDEERKRVRMIQAFDGAGLLFRQFLSEEPYELEDRRTERRASPRLTLRYAARPTLDLYAVAARGYKSGGYNDFAPTPERAEFAGERGDTVEAGFKSLLAGRQLALNLNLFASRVRDLQVSAYDGTVFYVQNAASARLHGAELELRGRRGGWSSFASLGWLDARYGSFLDAPARADQDGDTQDLSGARLNRAPEWTGALGLDYESAAFGPGLRWLAGVDAQYRSRNEYGLDNDPADAEPAQLLWNARLGLGAASGHWNLRVDARNLGDTLTRNASNDVVLFAGNHWAEVNPPRRVAAVLELAW